MNPSYDFTGRVAFVTGASSGMGLATARAFAEAVAAVTLADVNADALAGDLDRDEAAANQPIGRLRTAEEMAAAVLWLCSPGASFVVGVALPVDGGYTAR
jgi:NAD(P)-dependent dehydrogenase (short-subunit alcohol dehydrogenase family)